MTQHRTFTDDRMFLRPTAGQDRDRDHLFYLFPNLGYIVVHCVSVKETLTLYTLSCGSFLIRSLVNFFVHFIKMFAFVPMKFHRERNAFYTDCKKSKICSRSKYRSDSILDLRVRIHLKIHVPITKRNTVPNKSIGTGRIFV